MSAEIKLVYVAAGAETAPAASLQALSGARRSRSAVEGRSPAETSSAVLIPPDVPSALRRLIEAAADAGAQEIDPRAAASLIDRGDALVAAAGPRGPELARALFAAAEEAGVRIVTVPERPLFDDCLIAQELLSLQGVTRVLRERCPWDRVQTSLDIVSYSLEEVYELADAIIAGDLAQEHGELGDVLFQVYFLSLLLEERRAGDLGSVAARIQHKLVRRHPHIFADAVAETPAEVRGRWESIKREQEGREGIFHDVPASLSALLYARKLQRRAAEVGFDWDTAQEAFGKIAEEHAELAEALAAHGTAREFDQREGEQREEGPPVDREPDASTPVAHGAASPVREPASSETSPAAAGNDASVFPAAAGNDVSVLPTAAAGAETSPPSPEMRHDPRLRHEFGDLLFAVVNVARKAGIDPELALREAARRFERRVCAAAEMARAEGADWAGLGLADQERYYQRAKQTEGEGPR